jgi:hypothetical protein
MGNVSLVAPEKFSQILKVKMPKYFPLRLFVMQAVNFASDRTAIGELSSPTYFVRLDNIPG